MVRLSVQMNCPKTIKLSLTREAGSRPKSSASGRTTSHSEIRLPRSVRRLAPKSSKSIRNTLLEANEPQSLRNAVEARTTALSASNKRVENLRPIEPTQNSASRRARRHSTLRACVRRKRNNAVRAMTRRRNTLYPRTHTTSAPCTNLWADDRMSNMTTFSREVGSREAHCARTPTRSCHSTNPSDSR